MADRTNFGSLCSGDDSPQTTILEDEVGCCSTNNEEEPVLPPLVHISSAIKTKIIRGEQSTSADNQGCHHGNTSHKADEKSLLTPD